MVLECRMIVHTAIVIGFVMGSTKVSYILFLNIFTYAVVLLVQRLYLMFLDQSRWGSFIPLYLPNDTYRSHSNNNPSRAPFHFKGGPDSGDRHLRSVLTPFHLHHSDYLCIDVM